MGIFTKRNALVGYLTLKAHSRARRRWMRRQKRSAWKLVTLVVLGIVSVGIVVVLAGVVHRRQREVAQEGDSETLDEAGAEVVLDDEDLTSEPLPAT